MRRNLYELKSVGGDNSYVVPHPEKWGGDASPPPSPPIDARACPGSLPSSDLFTHICDLCLSFYPSVNFFSVPVCDV